MAQALIPAFPGKLEEIILVPSSGGCYEISVDDELVYSKLATRQHISDRDAIELVRKAVA